MKMETIEEEPVGGEAKAVADAVKEAKEASHEDIVVHVDEQIKLLSVQNDSGQSDRAQIKKSSGDNVHVNAQSVSDSSEVSSSLS